MSRWSWPRKNWTSFNLNGVDSDWLIAYSPGYSKKKNAITIMSAMLMLRAVLEDIATSRRRRIMGMGIGFTLFEGGSSLEYALYMQVIRKSTFPPMSKRGSGAPKERYVCATDRMYSLAKRDLTLFSWATSSPCLTRWRKTWRMGILLLTVLSRGSTPSWSVKEHHFFQWELELLALLVETPRYMSSCARPRSRMNAFLTLFVHKDKVVSVGIWS